MVISDLSLISVKLLRLNIQAVFTLVRGGFSRIWFKLKLDLSADRGHSFKTMFRKKFNYFFIFSLFFILALESRVNADELDQFSALKAKVEKFTLSNGIRVLVYKRDYAPVFSGLIWVRVGGVDEVPGTTGLSHFLEHMAFKGSETIGTKDYQKEEPLLAELDDLMIALSREEDAEKKKELEQAVAEVRGKLEEIWLPNEFSQIYKLRGAVGLNAGTSKDYTVYMVSLPNSAFDSWLWMESDRLLNPVFRQFYQEREVIQEERRSRVDDSPSGKLYEALLASAYWTHPNRLPVVGWPSDMKNLSVKDMNKLYSHYYRPDNIVISLAGDLDAEEIKPKLEKYFGRLEAVDEPLRTIYTKEEKQAGPREAVVYDDAEPRLFIGYHKPTYPNKDDAKFAVLHSVLSEGRSSLFYKELVQKKQIALSAYSTEAPGQLFPQLMILGGAPRSGVSNDRLRDEMQAIIDRLKTQPITDEQLESAKRRTRVSYLGSINSNYGMARTLGHAEVLWGDWQVIFEVYEDILNTTKEDIQRLAQTYLNIDNRTYVHLEHEKNKSK